MYGDEAAVASSEEGNIVQCVAESDYIRSVKIREGPGTALELIICTLGGPKVVVRPVPSKGNAMPSKRRRAGVPALRCCTALLIGANVIHRSFPTVVDHATLRNNISAMTPIIVWTAMTPPEVSHGSRYISCSYSRRGDRCRLARSTVE